METNQIGHPISIEIIANQKGGIGKTSVSMSCACLLSLVGHKTLFIDNDPQMNSSSCLLDDSVDRSKDISFIYQEALKNRNGEDAALEAIHPTKYVDLDIIPASAAHASTNDLIATAGPTVIRQLILEKAMTKVYGQGYEFIFVDDHPSLSAIETATMFLGSNLDRAANPRIECLIPTTTDMFSFAGINPMMEMVKEVSESANPLLNVKTFFNMANVNTNTYKDYAASYKEGFGDAFVPVSIQNDSSMAASATWMTPLPYLLGAAGFRATSQWKAIYDLIEFIGPYGIHLATESEHDALFAAYRIVEGKAALKVKEKKDGFLVIGIDYPESAKNNAHLYHEPENGKEIDLDLVLSILSKCVDPVRMLTIEQSGEKRKVAAKTILEMVKGDD